MPVNNMQPPIEESQDMAQPSPEMPTNENDMTDDDIAATLGFITTLSQQMMAPQETEESVEEGEGEVSSETEEVAPEPVEPEPEVDKDQEVLSEIKDEMADIKSQLEQLLKEEDVQDDEPEQKTES